MADEDALISWLKARCVEHGWHLLGDDGACLPAAPYVVTVDTQIAGVHFVDDLDVEILARRLLAVNLSDLAAMGAEPAFAFLALSAPRDFKHQRFFEALIAACAEFDMELAGGDLSTQPRTTLALTLLGRPSNSTPVGRDGGSPGHRLWLGGAVGESALGCLLVTRGARLDGDRISLPAKLDLPESLLGYAQRAVRRHLEPRPQLDLGRWLARQDERAAIDVSDGLARDLHRLCRASGVSAEIDRRSLSDLALSDLVVSSSEMGALALQLVDDDPEAWWRLRISGGEDYVLLFSLPPDIEPPSHFGCRAIGQLVRESSNSPRVVLFDSHGRQPLPPAGWDHLSSAP